MFIINPGKEIHGIGLELIDAIDISDRHITQANTNMGNTGHWYFYPVPDWRMPGPPATYGLLTTSWMEDVLELYDIQNFS